MEIVRPLYGVLWRMVVLRPLGFLHPVQYVVAVPAVLLVQVSDALFLFYYLCEPPRLGEKTCFEEIDGASQ